MELFEFVNSEMQRRDINSNIIKLSDVMDGAFVVRFSDRDLPLYFAGENEEMHAYILKASKFLMHMASLVGHLNYLASVKKIHVLDSENSTMHDFVQLVREVTT